MLERFPGNRQTGNELGGLGHVVRGGVPCRHWKPAIRGEGEQVYVSFNVEAARLTHISRETGFRQIAQAARDGGRQTTMGDLRIPPPGSLGSSRRWRTYLAAAGRRSSISLAQGRAARRALRPATPSRPPTESPIAEFTKWQLAAEQLSSYR